MKRINRDKFQPSVVLETLAKGKIPVDEANRLLEESCHAICRDRLVLLHITKMLKEFNSMIKDKGQGNDV
jgi:hypothetical protein